MGEPSPPQSPEDLPRRFADAWNARDPDALASLFDADAEFVNVTGLWWHDREAIRKAHAYGLSRIFERSLLEVESVRLKPLSADVAVVHARMRLTGQSPVEGASRPGTRRTVFSFVVRRTAEGWSCASAQNTDVVPGAETHVVGPDGRLRGVSYREGSREPED